MISVSTIGCAGMPDIKVWPEIILDIALWVTSQMASGYAMSIFIKYHYEQN